MGKPVDRKLTRKISRKMGRIVGGADAAAPAAVPSEATPGPLPPKHLLTRRERMLKSVYSKRSAAPVVGAKKTLAGKQRSTPTAVVTAAPQSESPGGGSGESTELRINRRSGSGGPARKKGKPQDIAAAAVAAAAKKTKLGPVMQRKTTMNLKQSVRHDLFVNELNLFNRVVQMPQFTEDPFGCIEQHLDGTMKRLNPQTPDFGRRPVPAQHTAGSARTSAAGHAPRQQEDPRRAVRSRQAGVGKSSPGEVNHHQLE